MELELRNVSKEFDGVSAVSGVSVTMRKGVYGLLGVNGAGKTTLMRMLCTLIRPTADVYCIHQRNPARGGKKKDRTAIGTGRHGEI